AADRPGVSPARWCRSAHRTAAPALPREAGPSSRRARPRAFRNGHRLERSQGRLLLLGAPAAARECAGVARRRGAGGSRVRSRRPVRRPDLTLATMDHNVPTNDEPAEDISARQIEAMARNAREFGVRCYPTGDPNQGIVHVISPQLGLTQPGMTIVCGDSHTSTHGALGALAWGIGTSEIEHVLATQTIAQTKPGTMAVTVEGALPAECAAKDVILGIIARIG